MTFTDDLWAATAVLQERIRTMPFNTELAAGTLPAATFRDYLVQDAHYLDGFARALALAAGRAPDAATIEQLAKAAHGTIAVERQLHSDYMAAHGITPEDFAATSPSRTCDHYVSFLLRSAALDPFPIAVAAVLPCFWIYHEVGRAIHARAGPDHPYRAWIDTYACPAFADSVAKMRALADGLGALADDATRASMRRAFARASWHEWMFWDSAYRRAGWE